MSTHIYFAILNVFQFSVCAILVWLSPERALPSVIGIGIGCVLGNFYEASRETRHGKWI